MLARYHISRGKRAPEDPLPEGHRIDVRARRHHVLSPEEAEVTAFLEGATTYREFARAYKELLANRFARDRAAFETLADEASRQDVYIGCNCPTHKNPDVKHCHTVLALQFMKQHYPKLDVRLPD
jgi:hypothetical protein